MAQGKKESLKEVAERIAKQHIPGIETLETRNMDSLDFHDVAVWSLAQALVAMWAEGHATAVEQMSKR